VKTWDLGPETCLYPDPICHISDIFSSVKNILSFVFINIAGCTLILAYSLVPEINSLSIRLAGETRSTVPGALSPIPCHL
jgi:hypothetical protein